MTSSTKLSIIFLNFNKLAETRLTSNTLQALCKDRQDIEIIAVDNGSSDGTAEFLQAQPHLISILLPDNSGIAGYSAGFQRAKGEYLLVLDDDSNPTSLSHLDKVLEKFSQHPHIGIIAAHIITPEGTPNGAGTYHKQITFPLPPFLLAVALLLSVPYSKKWGGIHRTSFYIKMKSIPAFKLAYWDTIFTTILILSSLIEESLVYAQAGDVFFFLLATHCGSSEPITLTPKQVI
jgi:hypothetical protein